MPQLRENFADHSESTLQLDLTADEYRLLADLLLDHMGSNPVRSDQLSSLAQRLYVLAVQAERNVPKLN